MSQARALSAEEIRGLRDELTGGGTPTVWFTAAAVGVPEGRSGKVIAMWMPIMLFFYMGFEHSIVNMFLFPSGLLLGGDFSVMDYLVWNEIPTVLGNLVGGLTFVGLTLYATHARTGSIRPRPAVLEPPITTGTGD